MAERNEEVSSPGNVPSASSGAASPSRAPSHLPSGDISITYSLKFRFCVSCFHTSYTAPDCPEQTNQAAVVIIRKYQLSNQNHIKMLKFVGLKGSKKHAYLPLASPLSITLPPTRTSPNSSRSLTNARRVRSPLAPPTPPPTVKLSTANFTCGASPQSLRILKIYEDILK